MRPLLTLLFLVIMTLPTQAQNSEIGYEGKRMFFELGVSLGPNLSTPTASNRGPSPYPTGRGNTGHFTLADRYSIAFNYILRKKLTLHAGYDFSFFGMSTFQDIIRTKSKLDDSYFDNHDLFYQLAVHDINCNIAISPPHPRNIAPYGFYWSFGLRFLFIQGYKHLHRVEYYNRPFLTDQPLDEYLDPLKINPFTFMVGVTAQWGYRFIIAKKVLVNIGLQINFFPQVFAFAGQVFNPNSETAQQDHYTFSVMGSTSSRHLAMLYIGVGLFVK